MTEEAFGPAQIGTSECAIRHVPSSLPGSTSWLAPKADGDVLLDAPKEPGDMFRGMTQIVVVMNYNDFAT